MCGCIFWKWWACVLILLGAAAIIAGFRLALFFIDLKWYNRESGRQYKTNNNHEYFDTNIEKVELTRTIDIWMLSQLNQHIKEATEALEGFQTRKALQESLFLLKNLNIFFISFIKLT